MWCELINIIDVAKAAKRRVLLQAKWKEQENRSSSLQVEWLLALPQASGTVAILFWDYVRDLLLDLLSHIHFAFQ